MKTVSVKEMRELDRAAIEDRGILSIALMENAGRAVSEIALSELKDIKDKKVAIFYGGGNNGEDGFVAARHLFNKGIDISVYLIGRRANLKNDPKINAEALISADVPSGLDADTGEILGVAVKAGITVTMQFLKQGFYKNKGPEYAGKIIVADIGI